MGPDGARTGHRVFELPAGIRKNNPSLRLILALHTDLRKHEEKVHASLLPATPDEYSAG